MSNLLEEPYLNTNIHPTPFFYLKFIIACVYKTRRASLVDGRSLGSRQQAIGTIFNQEVFTDSGSPRTGPFWAEGLTFA